MKEKDDCEKHPKRKKIAEVVRHGDDEEDFKELPSRLQAKVKNG